jgi:putative ABC transport system permease protein
VRREVRALDANAPVFDAETLEQRLAEFIAPRTFSTLLMSIFAGIATWLAAAGIYAVMSFSVSERSRELGVRVALGATPARILWLVASGGMALALIGIVLGVLLAWAQVRLLESMLFDLSATDVGTFLSVGTLFVLVALAACFLPAWRALRTDPYQALRVD